MRWDGGQWSSAAAGSVPGTLNSIDALSSNNIWAVGRGENEPLIMHWNGAQWSVVSAPDTGWDENVLMRVKALAADDVWAVGEGRDVGGNYQALTLHWNGQTWSVVPSQVAGAEQSELWGVTGVSASDVWAVGQYTNPGDPWTRTLIMRWNGEQWSLVPSPNVGPGGNILRDVEATGANDAWAVGYYYQDTSCCKHTLTLRWDGAQWSHVASPNASTVQNDLYNVTALSTNEVWAVGEYGDPTQGGALAMRWSGLEWSLVPAGGNGYREAPLFGIAPLSSSYVWAVGLIEDQNGMRSQIQRYSLECGSPTVPPVTGTVTGTAVATGTRTSTATATTCAPGWSHVASPNVGQGDNYLWSVSAANATNVWAAGYYRDAGGGKRTLTMRWDGAVWAEVASPNGGPGDNELFGVKAIAPNDVWAVGQCGGCAFMEQTLALHWDGSQWQESDLPDVDRGRLRAITAAGAGDVWAVGAYGTDNRPLVMRRVGAQWMVMATPSLPGTFLNGIAVLAPNDVWVVGEQGGTFAMHWNGQDWTVMPTPNPGSEENYLIGVAGAASDDVWAVGYYRSGGVAHTLITRWNGTQWNQVASPSPGTYRSYFYGIAALAPNDVWAVGGYGNGTEDPALVAQWDGTGWDMVSGPTSGAEESYLHGISAVSPGEMWTVGADYTQVGYRTLTARYTGVCPSVTPIPGASVTPTATLTAAPTACTITFSDVPPGHTFYEFVRCLACRGILGGYSDGTFRPGNDITRGQLAKVVSSAAGIEDPPGEARFEDVPSSHTFFIWVQRLAGRGHIGGYPCGGVGESCVPTRNRPYFRPQGEATRGQIAKIVSNAAGFVEPVSGQTFEDVPTGNPFYLWIERLAVRGIMGGYVCGGVGEPCGPGNRPYFRPGNNATRGQVAKIVANAFFPECE
jgi:hypothetical protein